MEKPHSAVQTTTTAHCQSVERTDEELLAEALKKIFPEGDKIYAGSGAFTIGRLAKATGYARDTIRGRVQKLVDDDIMVEVLIRIRDKQHRNRAPIPAYVMRDVYDNWIIQQGDKEENNA